MNIDAKSILGKRHYFIGAPVNTSLNSYTKEQCASVATFLMTTFGIEATGRIDHLSREVLTNAKELFNLQIPSSFYANPQDLTYFTAEELAIEQFLSYFMISITGEHNKDTNFRRIQVFKKAYPDYEEGKDMNIRTFTILNSEEGIEKLKEIYNNYCTYSRPFALEESLEFVWLFENGYSSDERIQCKDNIFLLLKKDVRKYAPMLDAKDLVKYSIQLFTDKASFVAGGTRNIIKNSKDFQIIKEALPLVNRNCEMTKKQAKYFNKLAKETDSKIRIAHNSAYQKATKLMKESEPVLAAEAFSKSGSLLERNLRWLLSRANTLDEADKILDLVDAKNPIVLYQMLKKIAKDNKMNSPRTFSYFHNNKVVNYTESEYEAMWRKSFLNGITLKRVLSTCEKKILDFYSANKIGKVYLDKSFRNIGIPTNTSANGIGLDVLPTGSRVKIKGDYIRTFCFWKDAFDIDASAVFYDENFGQGHELSWRTYATKRFGDSALSSGDCRAKDGSEFQDFKLDELLAKGYRYCVYSLQGYGDLLNKGEIYCGYQDKSDLQTKAWDPKNIAFKVKVKSDSRNYIGFVIDLKTREMIIINQNIDCDSAVVTGKALLSIRPYLVEDYLEKINMYEIIKAKATELVDKAEDASYIFSDNIKSVNLNQKLIHTYDLEKLVALLK